MSRHAAISAGLIVLALLVAPIVFAADGPPNLGTAAVTGEDGATRWFIDARIFDSGPGQDDLDNRTLSVGLATPVNDGLDFMLQYSSINGSSINPINGAIRSTNRDVIGVAFKSRLNGKGSNPCISVTGGLDVGGDTSVTGTNTATNFFAKQDPIIPAAKMQIEWGKPGGTQFQIAGQVAWWDDTVPATNGVDIDVPDNDQ